MKTSPSTSLGATGGRGLRILVLRSRFNDSIVAGLAEGASDYLREVGAAFDVELVPGAFELPLVALVGAQTGRYDAVVVLGAVIQGQTDHYEHIARECAHGLMNAALATGVPMAFGVLTVTRQKHAIARSQPGPENKGREAASAAIESAVLMKKLGRPRLPVFGPPTQMTPQMSRGH